MNIINLLTKKRHIAGIEINDSSIRIAYFKEEKNGQSDLVLIQEELPEGLISNGIILDKNSLENKLHALWAKENLTKSYAVVSIPEDKVYSHVFSFPQSLNDSQLKDAISLATEFQLPFKKGEINAGFEIIENNYNVNQVLISAIPKNIADEYIKVLDNAGINVLALESHLASITRVAKFESEKPILIKKDNKDSSTIFVIKDNYLYFSRTIPSSYANEKEISKTKKSIELEMNDNVNEFPFTQIEARDEYKQYLTDKNQHEWITVLGATVRGKIEQGKDNKISLLPMGTAEAYAYQKTKIFIALVRNITISISLFFLLTFIAAYIFIFSISQKINSSNQNISISPITKDIALKENLIKKVNEMTKISDSFLSETVNWSILINEINNKTVDGIIISGFNAPSIVDSITIVGIASNRDSLNLFKKSLQESTYLDAVELPITNLEKKKDIPFSITFKIKNPKMLYYK